MIRVIAVLTWLVIGLTAPAQACSPNANSTFCADSWVAQPMGRVHADEQRNATRQAGDGGDGDPSFAGDDIYVEGAVAMDDPPAYDEEPL